MPEKTMRPTSEENIVSAPDKSMAGGGKIGERLGTNPTPMPDMSDYSTSEVDDFLADLRETARDLDQSGVEPHVTGVEFETRRTKARRTLDETTDRENAKNARSQLDADERKNRERIKGMEEARAAGEFVGGLIRVQRIGDALGEQVFEDAIQSDGPIEDLSIFNQVTEPDEFGCRRAVRKERFYILDSQNRILRPFVGKERLLQDWFVEAYEFKARNWLAPFLRKSPLAIVKCEDGGHGFLEPNGQFFPFRLIDDHENIKIYFSESDVPGPEEMEADRAMAYWKSFVKKIDILADQQQSDSRYGLALRGMADGLRADPPERDWESVLSRIKSGIEVADLPERQKVSLLLEVRQAADQSDVDDEFAEALYAMGEVGKEPWLKWGEWSKGYILRVGEGKGIHFVVSEVSLQGIRPTQIVFGKMGPIVNGWAPVQTDSGWNLFHAEGGVFGFKEEVEEIEGPSMGYYRIRKNGLYHFSNAHGEYLVPRRTGGEAAIVGFEKAKPFEPKTKTARVWLEGVEYVMNCDGEMMPFEEVLKYAQWTKDQLETRKSSPDMSKEDRQRVLLSSLPRLDAELTKPKIGPVLMDMIKGILEENPSKAEEGIRLFGWCREEINQIADAMEKGLFGDGLDLRVVQGGAKARLEDKVLGSGLPKEAKLRFCRFLYQSDRFRWKRIDPLPVPMRVAWDSLIRESVEGEAELLRLAHRLESLISRSGMDAQRDKEVLFLPMMDEVGRALISPWLRAKAMKEVMSMEGSPHYYWPRGSSMDDYQPSTESGKAMQDVLGHPKSVSQSTLRRPDHRLEAAQGVRLHLAWVLSLAVAFAAGAAVERRFHPDWFGAVSEMGEEVRGAVRSVVEWASSLPDLFRK